MNMPCCLSPQEALILGEESYEKLAEAQGGRQRVLNILNSFQAKKPCIDIERAKYFTESMKETEGQPLVLRWAKAMKHIAENITVHISANQLLAGRAGKAGRYGILYPEIDGDFYKQVIKELPSREQCPFVLSDDEAQLVLEEMAPYWEGKTFHEHLNNALPESVHNVTYCDPKGLTSRYVVNETASYRSSLQWVHDYEKVLKRGFEDLKQEALDGIAALNDMSPLDTCDKKPFLEAMVIISDAIMLWARRHAQLALDMAASEKDPQRKQELINLSKVCEHVPAHPARNFYEAVQSQWFVQVFSRLEQKTGAIISNGRMDQYFYPYYEKDMKEGAITEQSALELLECMWVEMAQFLDLYISPNGNDFNEGYAHWEALTIGGQTIDGIDATNDLTYLFLRSKREFPLNYPDLAARIHSRSPERYLWEVAETIKYGSGFPKLINDEEIVPLLIAKGATFEEAFDYAVSGCTEARMPNRDTYTSGCVYINFAAALEMVLYNGRMEKYGDELIGLETGDPTSFSTWPEFWNAFRDQSLNLLRHAFAQQYIVDKVRPQHFAAPFASVLHDLCMKDCKDLHSPKIEGGIDFAYFEYIGYGTVVDSLSAIKKWVFEEKRLSMSQVIDALKSNFEGAEIIRQLLKNAPCYGNNDPAADAIAREVDRICLEYAKKYSEERGVFFDLRLVPITSHVPFGRVVSATPNGRVAWSALSDGSSASHGADVNGPTAVLLSNHAAKDYGYKERASRLLNLKLSPKCVAGEDGTRKLISMIRTFCDLKLWHLQFNIINKQTLLDAQKDPDKYRSLLVRVAGYSAYFVDLSPDLQNDIIERTEHAEV